MDIRGIIFDLDGTLIDTIEDIGDSMNEVLKSLGREKLSYDEYRLRVGGGFKNLVARTCPDLTCENYDLALARLEEAYRKNYLKKSRAYPNMEELLIRLEGRGIKLGINTNKNQEYTKALLNKIFPTIGFIKVVGVDNRNFIKPDPRGAELILEKMGLDRSQVLYIGDSNVDMETGKNAGMKRVGVDWGFRGEKELREYGADYIVYDPLEILNLI